MDKVKIFGVGVDAITLEGALGRIQAAVASNGRLLVSHANITGLNLAYEQSWLKDFYNRCDLVYCDGMGVQLAARLVREAAAGAVHTGGLGLAAGRTGS